MSLHPRPAGTRSTRARPTHDAPRYIPRWLVVPALPADEGSGPARVPASCAYAFPRKLTPTLAAAIGELDKAAIVAAVHGARTGRTGYRLTSVRRSPAARLDQLVSCRDPQRAPETPPKEATLGDLDGPAHDPTVA